MLDNEQSHNMGVASDREKNTTWLLCGFPDKASMCLYEPEVKRKVKPIEIAISKKGCWICTSHTSGSGRGSKLVIYRNGKSLQLHRYIYGIKHGPIQEGDVLVRTCSTDGCCNPEHYESKARWEIATEEFMYRNNPQGYYNMLFANKTRNIRTSIKREKSQHREIPDWLVAMVEKRVERAHLEALGETRSFYGRNTDIPFIKPDWAIMKPEDESEDKQLTS